MGNRLVKRLIKLIISLGLISLLGGFIVSLMFLPNSCIDLHSYYLHEISTWVVKITTSSGTSGATGFVVEGRSGKKYILTNTHVCDISENNILVVVQDNEIYQAEVYKRYKYNDLCVLQPHNELGKPATIARDYLLSETVWVIGHPLLEPKSLTTGELSGDIMLTIPIKMNIGKKDCDGPTYEFKDLSGSLYSFFGVNTACFRHLHAKTGTAVILPGNSGSPVVDIFGHVVAVAFAANESGTRGYFVPLEDIKDFLKEL